MRARMKWCSAAAIALIVIAATAAIHLPILSQSTDRELLKVQREIWTVWFAGDTARVRLLTPGLIAINPGGGPWGDQEAAMRGSASFHANGGRLIKLEFPQMRIQQFGDVAIVYTMYEYTTVTGRDTSHQAGRATEIFIKKNGKWVNPGWHMDSGK